MKTQTKTNPSQHNWLGEKNRPFQVCRPCSCGCDFRDGDLGVGYLTGSDAQGNGFTIWIQDEKIYRRVAKLLDSRKTAKTGARK